MHVHIYVCINSMNVCVCRLLLCYLYKNSFLGLNEELDECRAQFRNGRQRDTETMMQSGGEKERWHQKRAQVDESWREIDSL